MNIKSYVFLTNFIRFHSKYIYKNCYNMKVVYFRHLPEEENQLQINFRYTNSEFNVDRDFNFCRNINENIKVCLDRMKNNIEKELNKKQKKKKKSKQKDPDAPKLQSSLDLQNSEVLVQLIKDDNALQDDKTFTDLIKCPENLNGLVLRIAEEDFQIKFNTPWVAQLTLPTCILAGFLLYPSKLDLQFAQKEKCLGFWYKGIMPKSKNVETIQWEKIHEGLTYFTSTTDIGHLIKLELFPSRDGQQFGPKAECISKNEIQAGPGFCPFENRHNFTKEKLKGDKFRITTYNILADLYADSDYSRKELFPYCPPYALHIDYRKQLFIKEILGYNSDIVCLQEVDNKIFDLDLFPVLSSYNYKGNFQIKGKTGEGVAIFYDANRLELVENHGFTIGENITELEIFKNLWNKINGNEDLANRVKDRSTALQISLIRSKETNHHFLVANTHLYFHPNADHVRLLQIGFCMIYLEHQYKKYMEQFQLIRNQLSLIFCGDFNSVPECGIYKLMIEKHVDDSFVDWRSHEPETVKGVCLSQPFNIQSACGCPKYTNYTTLFSACLDYIFYQTDNLDIDEVIPLPTEEELKAHIAIPSVVFPSDHIALVANIKLRKNV